MGARLHSWWQQIKTHPVRTVLMALLAVVIVLIIVSIFGYLLNWDWTGLNASDFTSTPQKIRRTIAYQPGKTLWDWLQLLIIPAVLAVAGYVINLTISRGEQEATEQRAKSERKVAKKRARTERDIAQDNQREASLQQYIDNVSELLLLYKLRDSKPEDEVRKIARVRTLTVLLGLDPIRKRSALQFLYGSGLIDKDQPIIELQGAKLREADLRHADLSGANMHGVDLLDANMRDAILDGVNPNKAFFTLAQLDSAKSHEGIDMSDAFVG